ncbi:MAG: asparaginase [candidate division Zixibacteria bacterium]|nr:asparaginase [candidate division Zixibacteria bacterium]
MTVVVAKVYRGEREESVHYGSIAVVNKEGKLTHYVGDPEFSTFVRSSSKPFQLIPLIQTGAAHKYRFNLKQLAIMCGSHIGTDQHREVVLSNLEAAGTRPEDLKCGTHLPIFMQISGEYPHCQEHKDPLRHNCSGKHSGFLALSRFLGEEIREYLNSQSKAQQMILEAVAKIYEYPKEKILLGIDGCSAPNFGMPLIRTAIAFKKLANAEGGDPRTSMILAHIKKAITDFPEMVSGEGRFDLALMRSFPGNIICKGGAEAIQGIGFIDPPIGVAVKIHDGNARALYPVCLEVLKQMGLIDIDRAEYLKPFYNPPIRNFMNLLTGSVRAEFTLIKI